MVKVVGVESRGPGALLAQRRARYTRGLFAALLVGVALVVACGGGSGTKTNRADDLHAGLAASTAQPSVEATIDLARPTVVANANPNLTNVSQGDRIIIGKFGVDASLTYRAVGPDGQMPNPDGPDDVAYYDFSAWPGLGGGPGKGGNAVFAGHVDSGQKACKNGSVKPPCEAVFWDISRLRVGDEIEVRVSAESFRYRVATNQPVNAATGPWDQIVSATAEETITLITCGGDFNRETREYTNRQVVTGIRIRA